MKIVFLDADTVGNVDLSAIVQLGNLITYNDTEPSQIVERCKDAQVVITNKVKLTRDILLQLSHLKLVCIAATGMNNVDLECAREMGLPVKNVAGYSTDSVAQVTFAMLLTLVHHISFYDQFVKSGQYAQSRLFTNHDRPFYELPGKVWGIIGLGAIGRRVAEIAKVYGMKTIYFSTSGQNNTDQSLRVSLEELLQRSDVVSIHCPLSKVTYRLLTEKELKMMKPTAFLVNTARGKIVDEYALASALDNHWIAGAAVDVFEQEPMAKDNPLLNIRNKDNLILLPHIGWASVESRQRLIQMVANNIVEHFTR